MSHPASPSMQRQDGAVRICQEWDVRRSTFYHQRRGFLRSAGGPTKRGPKTSYTDEALTAQIRQVLTASPFVGEGHRKVWVRLRVRGIHTSKRRVLRLMRQAGLLAPSRAQRVLGPHTHDGIIITAQPHQMWGTYATGTITLEGIGIHAAKHATRFETLEPLHQGARQQCGAFPAAIAAGLQLRHDHGSQYISADF